MRIAVYLRDTRTAYIDGVTGDPSEVIADISSGSYRDIFSLTTNLTGITFPGDVSMVPPERQLPLPAGVVGNIIPTGNVTIEKALDDTESTLSVATFQTAISDEISHTPPRTLTTQESFWAFPFTLDGVSMHSYWRQSEVIGWGNVDKDV